MIGDYSEEYVNQRYCSFGDMFGGGGGQSMDVTTRNIPPAIPEKAEPISNALLALSQGLLGSPVNFNATPMDRARPPQGPPSLGALNSPAFGFGLQGQTPFGAARARVNPQDLLRMIFGPSSTGMIPGMGAGRAQIMPPRRPGVPPTPGSLGIHGSPTGIS